jgi:hypothetical protein
MTPAGRRYLADVSGQTVVLDIDADRYFLVKPRVPDSGSGSGSGPGAKPVVTSDEIRTAAANPLPPNAAVWAEGMPRIGLALQALAALSRVTRVLDRRPFSGLIDLVQAEAVASRSRAATTAQVLASFEVARPFFSRPRICRLDAPALCLLLRRNGLPAHLVFGARLEPFAAHCWTQVGASVVGEPAEKIGMFTPIVAV